jgi:EamA domain-containing membrane protein RarD
MGSAGHKQGARNADSIAAFALCIGYAVYRFDRKDIVSSPMDDML